MGTMIAHESEFTITFLTFHSSVSIVILLQEIY